MINEELSDRCLVILKTCVGADEEIEHVRADDALCSLLRKLGYTEVVNAFEAIPKWYA